MGDEKSKMKVALEQAEQEFDVFCEAWNIDNEYETMTEDDQTGFLRLRRSILRDIRKGKATVSEDGVKINLTLLKSVGDLTDVTIKIPEGVSYLDADKYKPGQGIHRLHAFISAASGLNPKILSRMSAVDVKFLHNVATLFLAS
jgi:hypothetical protein